MPIPLAIGLALVIVIGLVVAACVAIDHNNFVDLSGD